MSTNNMDRFEFRCIRPEETQQAIEIEQICFPPNEACSPKSLTERIKATAETFLVAEDKETGKLAAFLNGVPTDEEAFRDEFFTDISLSNPERSYLILQRFHYVSGAEAHLAHLSVSFLHHQIFLCYSSTDFPHTAWNHHW